MRTDRRRQAAEALFCFLAAAAALLICSMDSYLYPLNPWDDANCFVTVGRGILAGKLPYRDFVEQKGPLLYALHALALWVSPGNYHGVYWLETVCLAGALFFSLRTARLYAPKLNVGWAAAMAAAICVSRAFRYGDSAEELCLLPMAWSLYALLKTLRTNEPLSGGEYVLHGFLAGCVLWIKFNLLALHFVWMAFLAIDAARADRSLKRAAGMCLRFLAGMALATAPWLIWFGARGALSELWNGYFLRNILGYGPRNHSAVAYAGAGLLRSTGDPWLMAPLLLAMGFVLLSRGVSGREKRALGLIFCAMSLAIYGSGYRFVYYFMAFAVFLPLAAAGVSRALGRICLPASAACALLIVSAGLIVAAQSANVRWIGYPYADTAQGRLAALVQNEPDVSLLNVGCLDQGMYAATDTLPPTPYFVKLNLDEQRCLDEQRECLTQRRPRYAVTLNRPLEDYGMGEGYALETEIRSDYAGRGRDVYYLYRRREAQ